MDVQHLQQGGPPAGDVHSPVARLAKENTMIATTRSSGWFRRGAAGLAVLLAAGTLGAGLAGRLQMGVQRSPVAAPAANMGGARETAARDRYEAFKLGQLEQLEAGEASATAVAASAARARSYALKQLYLYDAVKARQLEQLEAGAGAAKIPGP